MVFGPSSPLIRSGLPLRVLATLVAGLPLFCLGSQAQQATPTPAASAVRILAPKTGERISTSFVDVKYELAASATAASSPTFQLRLDARDPVHTTDQQQTFTGLEPGKHTITIEVLDANSTAVAGTRSEVQFTVVNSGQGETLANPGTLTASGQAVRLQLAAFTRQASDASDPKKPDQSPQQQLPRSGSALPLLFVIGVGVLIGGIISARRTRPRRSTSERQQ